MKFKEKIYMSYRLIEKREKGEFEKQFCLDSKNRPRVYSSMETLEEYMPEEYFDVAVYELKHFRFAGKLHKQKLSRKRKRKLRKMKKEKQRLNEMEMFNFYKRMPHIYSSLPIYPGRFKDTNFPIQEEERFYG